MTTGQTAAVAIKEQPRRYRWRPNRFRQRIKRQISYYFSGNRHPNRPKHQSSHLSGINRRSIGVFIAAAAAMAYFASQMNKATDSVNAYNSAAAQIANPNKEHHSCRGTIPVPQRCRVGWLLQVLASQR
jgi:hypothetical protein